MRCVPFSPASALKATLGIRSRIVSVNRFATFSTGHAHCDAMLNVLDATPFVSYFSSVCFDISIVTHPLFSRLAVCLLRDISIVADGVMVTRSLRREYCRVRFPAGRG